MTNGYHHHMFICSHERPPDASRECCAAKESLALMKALKFAAKQEGVPSIRVQKSGCLGQCRKASLAWSIPKESGIP